MKLSNKWYQIVKWLVGIVLPAFSGLYFGLSKIWGIPGAENVVGTLALVTVFLGTILGVSTNKYEGDGEITLSQDDENQVVNIHKVSMPDIAPEELAGKKRVVLKIAR